MYSVCFKLRLGALISRECMKQARQKESVAETVLRKDKIKSIRKKQDKRNPMQNRHREKGEIQSI